MLKEIETKEAIGFVVIVFIIGGNSIEAMVERKILNMT